MIRAPEVRDDAIDLHPALGEGQFPELGNGVRIKLEPRHRSSPPWNVRETKVPPTTDITGQALSGANGDKLERDKVSAEAPDRTGAPPSRPVEPRPVDRPSSSHEA